MDGAKYVIAGGGMVAGYAARQFVESGGARGELVILSADSSLPYERPPLSKGFLAGRDSEDAIRINAPEFYSEHGIDVRLGCRIAAVDTVRRRLALASGGEFAFEKLILATGSRARTLSLPGADLAGGVRHLRSLDDARALRAGAAAAKQALVIGGGFIGMEVAAVLAQQGIETAMVVREERIGQRLFSPEMSGFFQDYYAAHGVRFFCNAKVAELRGDGALSSAVLAGGREVAAQLVVAGIGASPVTDPLAGSGIEVADGVMVNEYLETAVPGIFAAGDIANYPDALFGKRRRVEHWDNAVATGQHCARALSGERIAFRHVPYFFSDVFDLSYEFWGDNAEADRVIRRGDLSSARFSAWWLRGDKVVAAFVMNRPDEERELAPRWIESARRVSSAALGDTSLPLAASVR